MSDGWAPRLIACAIGVFLCVLVVETIFGSWIFGSSFGFLNVPRNVVIRHDLREIRPGGGIALYRKDKYGLRGSYGKPSEIDILVVGGSTTNEFYVGEGETWADVMATELRRYSKTLRVANAGVDGHSTVGHIRSFEAWFPEIPGLRPKYVLFYIGINDSQLENREAFDRLEELKTSARFVRYVKNNSALYYLIRLFRGWNRASRANIIHSHSYPPLKPVLATIHVDPQPYTKALNAYANRIKRLDEQTREMGSIPIFVTQQRGGAFVIDGVIQAANPESVRWQAVQRLYNAAMMTACRAVSAICIDLAEKIIFVPEDFSDLLHTTASGSRKIGRFLAAKLKDQIP